MYARLNTAMCTNIDSRSRTCCVVKLVGQFVSWEHLRGKNARGEPRWNLAVTYLTNYLLYAINLCLKKKITIFKWLRFSKCKNFEMSKLRDGVLKIYVYTDDEKHEIFRHFRKIVQISVMWFITCRKSERREDRVWPRAVHRANR